MNENLLISTFMYHLRLCTTEAAGKYISLKIEYELRGILYNLALLDVNISRSKGKVKDRIEKEITKWLCKKGYLPSQCYDKTSVELEAQGAILMYRKNIFRAAL